MANNTDLKPGHYDLNTFTITPYLGNESVDMAPHIIEFHISESIYSGFESGTAVIYDIINAQTKLPIKGEETLVLSYTDAFGKTFTTNYRIYSVTNMKSADDAEGFTYTVHFITEERFKSFRSLVQRSYKGEVSEIVGNIWDEFYNSGTKEIDITSTTVNINYVVPNLDPQAALQYLSKVAYSALDTSQSFRFFENREGFFFITIEELIHRFNNANNPIVLTSDNLDTVASIEEKVERGTRNVSAISKTKADTVNDINHGAYASTHFLFDYANQRITEREYDYYEEESKYYTQEHPIAVHSHSYSHDAIPVDRIQRWHFPNPVANPYGFEIQQDKVASEYHRMVDRPDIVISGRNDIIAGSIVDIQIDGFEGLHLVESIDNAFGVDDYTQYIKLSKIAGVIL